MNRATTAAKLSIYENMSRLTGQTAELARTTNQKQMERKLNEARIRQDTLMNSFPGRRKKLRGCLAAEGIFPYQRLEARSPARLPRIRISRRRHILAGGSAIAAVSKTQSKGI
jgi:hypothetical protein